jgi:hypothetical protein
MQRIGEDVSERLEYVPASSGAGALQLTVSVNVVVCVIFPEVPVTVTV